MLRPNNVVAELQNRRINDTDVQLMLVKHVLELGKGPVYKAIKKYLIFRRP
jgi:hypothetical protein